MRARARLVLGGLCLVVSGSGCASLAGLWAPRLAVCPGPIVSTDRIPDGLHLRQQHRVTGGGVDVALEVVVEKRPGVLVVVGFGALGAKSFAVTQRGVSIEAERFVPLQPVPPENVLFDLHRSVLARYASPDRAAEPGVSVEWDGRGGASIRNEACDYGTRIVAVGDGS